jgi:DNA-binding PadR family transcriptional regulator
MPTKRDRKTRFALLGMLAIQPMSGYDIRKTVEASIAHFWNESYGQIYPMLKGLAKERLIRCRSNRNPQRNRQEYAITPAGREALQQWLSESPGKQPVRNELLLKLFFARNARLQDSLQHLEEHRAALTAELTRFRQMGRDLSREHAKHPDLPYWLLTLRFGIRQSEAEIRWTDEALADLKYLGKSR